MASGGGASRNELSPSEERAAEPVNIYMVNRSSCNLSANISNAADGSLNDVKTTLGIILHGLENCQKPEVKDLLSKISPLLFHAEALFGQQEYKASLEKYIAVCKDICSLLRRWEGSPEEKKEVKKTAEALMSRAETIKSLCPSVTSELEKYLEKDMTRDVCIGYDSVCGPHDVIELLKERVVLYYRFPALRLDMRGPLMLYGHPGTGKSQLLEATAKESNVKLFVFNIYNLASRTYRNMGDAEKCMKAVFQVARDNRPCILCLEDIEMLCERDELYRKGKTETLVQIMPVKRETNKDLTIIGVTQQPWKLDASLRRRFLRKHVRLPTSEDRINIMKMSLKNYTHTLDTDFFREIGSKTEGYTGANMVSLVRDAMMMHIRSLTKAQYFKKVMVPRPDGDDTEEQSDRFTDTKNSLEKTSDLEDPTKSEANNMSSLVKDSDELYENLTGDRNLTELSASRKATNACDDIENGQCDKESHENVSDVVIGRNSKNCNEIEKFKPCTKEEEGAIKMTFLDIPAEKLLMDADVTKESMLAALVDARSSVADDDVARMMTFVEDFDHF